MPFVVSTLSNDQNYTDWNKPTENNGKVGRPAIVKQQVLVKGKANVITKNLITPEGVLTAVTDDQVEMLKKNAVFNLHLKNGHVKIINREATPAKVAKDMKDRDESAPLNKEKGDFDAGGRAQGIAPSDKVAQ